MTPRFHPPPFIPRLLFKKILPTEDNSFLCGDFDEIYSELVDERGAAVADRWYWGQFFRFFPKLMIRDLIWSLIMFKNYLKVTFRNLMRHKGYSFINIAGLSIGLACFILILLFVRYEFGYEGHNPNADRVYRIYVEHNRMDKIYRVSSTPVPLVPMLSEEVPEIEAFTRMDSFSRIMVSRGERKFNETNVVCADPGVFDIFGLRMISGNQETALRDVD
ncbi:MAG: ABC transporter permease, partial [Candidatus Aminicenantes bacterium]|nr:ABC transporter permease [Candidatus Aminicenantes bacterium]